MSVVLITGSSTGFGQETALHLGRKGHRVFASVRNPDRAEELSQKVAAEDLPVELLPLDVTRDDSVTQAVETLLGRAGRLDAVVNNAGIPGGRALEETPIEEAQAIFETNYFGTVRVLRAVVPTLREQRSGRIVNVSSNAGRIAFGAHGHYTASKFAVEGLSESLSAELAPFGVRVALIEPGAIWTPIFKKMTPPQETQYPASVELLAKMVKHVLRRADCGTTSDVAEAIADAIESPEPKFRYPVGPDARDLIEARAATDDEEWMKLMRLQGAEFQERWMEVVGDGFFGE